MTELSFIEGKTEIQWEIKCCHQSKQKGMRHIKISKNYKFHFRQGAEQTFLQYQLTKHLVSFAAELRFGLLSTTFVY